MTPGKAGAEEIQELMKEFRSNTPRSLAGSIVTTLIDYDSSESTNLLDGSKSKVNFPKSNVLQFLTEDGSKISVRPSGTEPKIKFYFSVKGDWENELALETQQKRLIDKIDQIKAELKLN